MSGDALLDAVYAAPEDKAARLVYGDWLLERGDPRGELIQLQLRAPKTKAQAAREVELIEAHAEQWIGRLTEITTWVEFELGFLARCGLRQTPTWAIGMREWATVKHVGIADRWNTGFAPLVTDAAMKSLESLRLPERALVALLRSVTQTRIRRLIVDGSIDATVWESLATSRALGELAEIEIRGRLHMGVPVWSSQLARVVFEIGGWAIIWTRGGDRRLSSLAAEPCDQRGRVPVVDDLLSYFAALPRDVIGAIDLTAVSTLPIERAKHALRKQVRVVDDL